LLNDFLKLSDQAPDQPFDVYLRWVFKRIGWVHTESIVHNWRSVGYSSCGAGLLWTANDGGGGFLGCEQTPLIIHGCKDDSLYQLILGGDPGPAKTAIAPPVLNEEAPATPQQKLAGTMIDALNVAIANAKPIPYTLLEKDSDHLIPVPQWVGAAADALSGKLDAIALQEAPQQPLSRFLLGPVTPAEEAAWPCTKQQFEEWLGTHSKAVRLRAMLEQFGFDKLDTCRRAIGFWGYEAPTPATFIRRKK